MFSIDEGGRASLIDATSKTGGTAVCPNHTIRANTRFIIGRLSVRSLPRLKSQRGACKRFPRLLPKCRGSLHQRPRRERVAAPGRLRRRSPARFTCSLYLPSRGGLTQRSSLGG